MYRLFFAIGIVSNLLAFSVIVCFAALAQPGGYSFLAAIAVMAALLALCVCAARRPRWAKQVLYAVFCYVLFAQFLYYVYYMYLVESHAAAAAAVKLLFKPISLCQLGTASIKVLLSTVGIPAIATYLLCVELACRIGPIAVVAGMEKYYAATAGPARADAAAHAAPGNRGLAAFCLCAAVYAAAIIAWQNQYAPLMTALPYLSLLAACACLVSFFRSEPARAATLWEHILFLLGLYFCARGFTAAFGFAPGFF